MVSEFLLKRQLTEENACDREVIGKDKTRGLWTIAMSGKLGEH
jgi:hypothetical protein